MFDCQILADSISDHGDRLTTFQLTYPRIIHSELMTHGMLARNGESSRARPVAKNIADVEQAPFIPSVFGKNQKGMQWSAEIEDGNLARMIWQRIINESVRAANALANIDVHKSLANRVLEPYKFYTAIFSGTDWSNFFALRTHPDAQPEFRTLALMMREAYQSHEPRFLTSGEWHLPYVSGDEIEIEARLYPEPFVDWPMWGKVSAGRCARVSVNTHDGTRDRDADMELASRLLTSGHMSPFAHQARPFRDAEWGLIELSQEVLQATEYGVEQEFEDRMARNLEYCAQFRGWWTQRASIAYEDDFGKLV